MKKLDFEKALREAAEQASVYSLQDDDWTVERLKDAYPNLTKEKARVVLNKMVTDGLAVRVSVKSPKGGANIHAFRPIEK